MRAINLIVIHCADTYERMDIGAKEIDAWHRERGFLKIGYHYVVRRDGTVEKGRDEKEVGAHAKGYNQNSIGICWVGGRSDDNRPYDNRTTAQTAALRNLVAEMKKRYPLAQVVGHRDLDKNKACPCFNAKREYK